ncbi:MULTISPECIES: group III truncated hemoglobin [Burkholderiaceae]|uniref:group III truncated hemoglobin n=1 Tax=Burkholderiaceae TaxID=119060 RepID=UPI000963644A|nr:MULTISPECIES: group III truncated hemoglobin [Burkholderiaceae]MCG1018323.1 group III truncated hemoglobin [Mycetohabitans sp. B4]SIT66578.1 hemoglobin [Burkholderia sp. b13]
MVNPESDAVASHLAILDEAGIHSLVHRFYARVRADDMLGPIFAQAIGDAWDPHLAKMCDFWASIALGAKRYKGNVQLAHLPLKDIEPEHFSRWLYLFLDTVEHLFEPAAALKLMEPALRIAESLQLGRFGWQYQVPPEQKALLERIAPRRGERGAVH